MVRSPAFLASLLYLGVLNLLFFPALWGNRTLMVSAADRPSILPHGAYHSSDPRIFERLRDPGSPAWSLEPNFALTHELVYQDHELPWWNPYQSFGTPYAAAMVPQPFFPLTILAAAHPSPRVVSWFVVLRLLIAGLLAYAFLRMFLGPMPSSIGGLAFMLSGYFVLNLNLDNLSTDVLLPLVLIAFERLLRFNAPRDWLFSIASVWLVLISGMPESAFVILMFGYCYFLIRASAVRPLVRLVICNLLGFSLSAFLLLPMVELLRHGFDVHRGSPYGLISVDFSRNVLLYLLPLATGPLYSSRYFAVGGQIFGYFGVSCSILALTAILTALHRERREHLKLIIFFALTLIFCFVKYFGLPPIQWLGYLPILKLVSFPQYLQSVMAFCLAALGAYGADALLKRLVREELLVAVLALSCATAIGAVSFGIFLHPPGDQWQFFIYSLELGAATAAVMLFIAWSAARWNKPRLIFAGLLALTSAELSLNYIYPIYFYAQPLPKITANPYQGAPYLNFLKQSGVSFYRVFGRDDELFPDWASAFKIFDSRLLAAIFPGRLFPFARVFFDRYPAYTGELDDRFTGEQLPYSFATSREQRYLQITSTRFLLSPKLLSIRQSPELIEKTLQQNAELVRTKAGQLNETRFTIDGDTRPVLFAHPPLHQVPLKVRVDSADPIFNFSPAMHPDLFGSKCGEGVRFILEVAGQDGKITPLYNRYINPKRNSSERHWFDESVDLSRFAGQEVKLLFSTEGGSSGNYNCDWAGWSGLSFGKNGSGLQDTPNLKLVYNAENKIYEYAHPLPRASLFKSIKLVSNEQAALKMLADPQVDLARQAIIVDHKLPPFERELLVRVERATQQSATAAQIVSFKPQKLTIRTSSDSDGVVMLTDTFYPGWRVYVDNQPRTVLQAGYMFRGVLVEKGSHLIEFRYQSSAITLGGFITLTGLIATLALLLYGARAQRLHNEWWMANASQNQAERCLP